MVCIVVGGLLLGVLNTVLTECVMEATDLPRSVASSAYSAVRFLGGAIAPPAATQLAASSRPRRRTSPPPAPSSSRSPW